MKYYQYNGILYNGKIPDKLSEQYLYDKKTNKSKCIVKYGTKYFHFVNGFAIVKNIKYGIINKNYEEICDCKYSWIGEFINNYALVSILNFEKPAYREFFGVIDRTGVEVIKCIYSYNKATEMLIKYKIKQSRIKKLKIFV